MFLMAKGVRLMRYIDGLEVILNSGGLRKYINKANLRGCMMPTQYHATTQYRENYYKSSSSSFPSGVTAT
jgi:hypothetical protein